MSRIDRRAALASLAALPTLAMSKMETHQRAIRPQIIAHRGASGDLPEHTLEAYMKAADDGADIIEPDLVLTKDGHLVCRHDRYLSTTTNIADLPVFARRRTIKAGRDIADWYVEDFTLNEIKSLKARQPFAARSKAFDDSFDIPSFAELLARAKQETWRLAPEVKHPRVAEALGYDWQALLFPFREAAANGAIGPSLLQCFDAPFLKSQPAAPNIEKLYLVIADPLNAASLSQIAHYADAIGPFKARLLGTDGRSNGIVDAAHQAGLSVYPWTFRADQVPDTFPDFAAELSVYFGLGVDGLFTDHSADAVRFREALR